jgi:DNA-binding NarL/FixJ family response regulator
MDRSPPKLNGVEATPVIHHEYPAIRIIGLSVLEEVGRAQALRDAVAVALAYLTKSGPSSDLVTAIHNAVTAKLIGHAALRYTCIKKPYSATGLRCKIPLQSNQRHPSRHIAFFQQSNEGT